MLLKVKELKTNMAEDEFDRIAKHRQSLQSTVKKNNIDPIIIDERMDSSGFKTPISHQRKRPPPPIVFGRRIIQQPDNKRAEK